jgi:hypothetical protein
VWFVYNAPLGLADGFAAFRCKIMRQVDSGTGLEMDVSGAA